MQKPEKIDIQCEFKYTNYYRQENFYTCLISKHEIPEQSEIIFNGQHKSGKSNETVIAIKFDNCSVQKVPRGLTKVFPNLRVLDISGSKLRTLSKYDLEEYKKFKILEFGGNPIEYLPGDLFEGFENLEVVSFTVCNLTFIEPNIFDGHDKLKMVCLSANIEYEFFYSTNEKYSGKRSLKDLRKYLYEKFYSRFKFVQNLITANDNLLRGYESLKYSYDIQKRINVQNKRYICNDIQNFAKDETFKDFQISIDDREFPVHKFLLAARSPTLAEMLRNNPEAENLKLVEISVEIFELILKFIYTDELPNEEGTNYLHLFAAAGKLKIDPLNDFAARKLVNEIDAENALDILKLSNKYEHEDLRQKAFEQVKKNCPEVVFKDNWINDSEKVTKVIEAFKVREELMRKAEEEFKKMLI